MFGALCNSRRRCRAMARRSTIGMGGGGACYTLAFTPNGPVTVQPHVIPTLAYKMDSLQPLCQIFAVQYVLAVRPDSPYRSLGELIAAAKAQPGKLSYGFGGVATAPHLAISQLTNISNFSTTRSSRIFHVPERPPPFPSCWIMRTRTGRPIRLAVHALPERHLAPCTTVPC
ncbi:MAG: hypothetical protein IPI73_25095 [Betaproteobacteria bacterium]|nr:hypothetical protein [Betaproteobacteria bacterium]